jgi:hypothetical protein
MGDGKAEFLFYIMVIIMIELSGLDGCISRNFLSYSPILQAWRLVFVFYIYIF